MCMIDISVKESPLGILWNLETGLPSFRNELQKYKSSLEKLMHAVGTPQDWSTEFGTKFQNIWDVNEVLLSSFQDFKSSEQGEGGESMKT